MPGCVQQTSSMACMQGELVPVACNGLTILQKMQKSEKHWDCGKVRELELLLDVDIIKKQTGSHVLHVKRKKSYFA